MSEKGYEETTFACQAERRHRKRARRTIIRFSKKKPQRTHGEICAGDSRRPNCSVTFRRRRAADTHDTRCSANLRQASPPRAERGEGGEHRDPVSNLKCAIFHRLRAVRKPPERHLHTPEYLSFGTVVPHAEHVSRTSPVSRFSSKATRSVAVISEGGFGGCSGAERLADDGLGTAPPAPFAPPAAAALSAPLNSPRARRPPFGAAAGFNVEEVPELPGPEQSSSCMRSIRAARLTRKRVEGKGGAWATHSKEARALKLVEKRQLYPSS